MFRNKIPQFLIQQSFKQNKISSLKCLKVDSNVKNLKCTFTSMTTLYSQQISTQKIKSTSKKNVEPVNKFVNRTHTCGELTLNNIDDTVQLCGWLEFQRMGKFIILRDSYGSTQCIIDEQKTEILKEVQDLPYESVLSITGTVIPRPKDQCNPKLKTGDIEVCVESLEILNLSKSNLPFYIRNFNKAKESLQMEYRYLALRFPELQRNLRIRSWVTMKMREYLINQCGFVDVSTPTLFRKTPGGAQEFLVPTQHKGKFYSLVQSPQQFKQLLMVGGIDRYFQLAQCYRDESSRSDRQPEFTQLDIEMSFVNREDVMTMIEELIINSWPNSLGILETPFNRLSYEEALEMYGTDCPDLRIPGKIHNITTNISGARDKFDKSFDIYITTFHEKQKFLTKSVKEKLINLSKQVFQKAKLIQMKISDSNLKELSNLFSDSVRKNIMDNFNLKEGDVLFLTYGPKSDARQLLGKIRKEFVNILESKGEIIRFSDYRFVWIYDFPLFEFDEESQMLKTSHHPFTQPHPKDEHYLFTDPLKVRGLQYDIVMNGSEIGGGSIRIHNKTLQQKIFKILNIDSSQINYLLEALDSGAPPHGGIALGLDRYISMICGASNIKEVIAFPKTMEGRDLMSGAPTLISEEDKKLYNIQIMNINEADNVL